MKPNHKHPQETTIACPSNERPAATAEHLRWCPSCRRVEAEHRWLQAELSATLAKVAGDAPVPTPNWRAVQAVIDANQQSTAVKGRALAVAGLALLACLAFLSPALWGTTIEAQAYYSDPSVALAPTPLTVVSRAQVPPVTTPTPPRTHTATASEGWSGLEFPPTLPTPDSD